MIYKEFCAGKFKEIAKKINEPSCFTSSLLRFSNHHLAPGLDPHKNPTPPTLSKTFETDAPAVPRD